MYTNKKDFEVCSNVHNTYTVNTGTTNNPLFIVEDTSRPNAVILELLANRFIETKYRAPYPYYLKYELCLPTIGRTHMGVRHLTATVQRITEYDIKTKCPGITTKHLQPEVFYEVVISDNDSLNTEATNTGDIILITALSRDNYLLEKEELSKDHSSEINALKVKIAEYKNALEASAVMCRMLGWVGLVWNDHNFQKGAHLYAKEALVSMGINTVDAFNMWQEKQTFLTPIQEPLTTFIEKTDAAVKENTVTLDSTAAYRLTSLIAELYTMRGTLVSPKHTKGKLPME